MQPESRQFIDWEQALEAALRASGLCSFARMELAVPLTVCPAEAMPSALTRGLPVVSGAAELSAQPCAVAACKDGGALEARLMRLDALSRAQGTGQGRQTLTLGRGRLRGPDGALTGPLLLYPARLERRAGGWVLLEAQERERCNLAALCLLPPECPAPSEGWSGYWNTLSEQLAAALDGSGWQWEDGLWLGLLPLWEMETAQALDRPSPPGTLGALLAAGEPWPSETEPEQENGEALLTPLPLDGVQTAALKRLNQGGHTLLSGGIGTGKRQMAAALAVNAMSRGARTLILSQREADREEVYDRLRELSLEPFCLRIPSQGDRRAAVLRQYNIAAQLHPEGDGEGFFTLSQQLERQAQRLDRSVAALHTPGKHGLSPFQLICRYLCEEETEGYLPLPEPMISHLDRDGLQNRLESAEALARAADALGEPSGHPLGLVWGSEYDPEQAARIPAAAGDLLEHIDALEEAGRQWCRLTGLELPERQEDWGRLCEGAGLLMEWRDYPASWASSTRIPLLTDAVVELEKRFERAGRLRAAIEARWEPAVFRLDAVALERQWHFLQEGWTLPSDPERERQLRLLLVQAESLLSGLEMAGRRWAKAVEIPLPTTRDSWERSYEVALELARWKEIPGEWGSCSSLQALLWDVGELIDHGKRAKECKEVLLRDWTEEFLHQDGAQLMERWQREGGSWGIGWLKRQTTVRAEVEPYCRCRLTADVLENGLRWLADYQEELRQCDEIYHRWERELSSVYHREDTVWLWLDSARQVASESHDWLAELTGSEDFLRRYGSSEEAVSAAAQLKESWEGARDVLGRLDVMIGRTGQPDSRDWLAERRGDCRRLQNLLKIRKRLQECSRAGEVSLGEIGQQLSLFAQYQQERRAIGELYGRWREELEGLFREEETDWEALHTMSIRAGNADEALAELTGDLGLRARLAGDAKAQDCARALSESYQAVREQSGQFARLVSAHLTGADGAWLPQLRESCRTIVSHVDELEAWMNWRGQCRRAESLGLKPFVSWFATPGEHRGAAALFRKSLYRALLQLELDWVPELRQFSARQLRETLRQYAGLQERFDRATCAELRARAIARLPDFPREEALQEERGLLHWVNQTPDCDIPLDELIGGLPQVTARTFACVLASPADAVRLYTAMPPEEGEADAAPPEPPFDYIVLLGAESLPAPVGCLTLGLGRTALLCAGEGALPDRALPAGESVWDACRALGLPCLTLRQCYLARPEGLLELQRTLYGEPSLPTSAPRTACIACKTVVGRLEDGVNSAEAAVAAEYAAERVRAGARSLAVAALTAPQAGQIAALLRRLGEEDKDLAPRLSEIPVLPVQNLAGGGWEEVVLSVTLAADPSGSLVPARAVLDSWESAAPLARAVTAARRRLTVFTSLDREEGAHWDGPAGVLFRFLREAAQERAEETETALSPRNEVERGLCRALEAAGYHAVPGPEPVSVQARRPEDSEPWTLGILLDGEAYAAVADTRTRELTQTILLQRQGWNLCRVWTMDWLQNREKVTEQLVRLLELLAQRAAEPEPEPGQKTPPEAEEPPLYTPAHLKLIPIRPGEVASPAFRDRIYRVAEQVLEQEAPVSQEQLTDRLLIAFTLDHRDAELRRHCAALWRKLGLRMTREEEQNFFWRTDQDPERYRLWRRSGTGEHRRRPEDVSCQEAANAVCDVLRREITLTARELIARTVVCLGYAPGQEAAVSCAARGLECALYMGRALETPIGSIALNPQVP